MDKEKKFDPQMEFLQRGIDWLFKQGVAITVLILFCLCLGGAVYLLWTHHEGQINELKADFRLAKLDLKQAKEDWAMCEKLRSELAEKVAALKVEVDFLKK